MFCTPLELAATNVVKSQSHLPLERGGLEIGLGLGLHCSSFILCFKLPKIFRFVCPWALLASLMALFSLALAVLRAAASPDLKEDTELRCHPRFLVGPDCDVLCDTDILHTFIDVTSYSVITLLNVCSLVPGGSLSEYWPVCAFKTSLQCCHCSLSPYSHLFDGGFVSGEQGSVCRS